MKTQIKKRSFLSEHRFAIGLFLYVTLYNFIVVTRFKFWETDPNGTYMHHIVDYKTLGFRAGLLPGSIYYGIFGENASVVSSSIFESVLIILAFLAVSILLERFIKRTEQQYKTAAFVLCLLYLSGPFTFSVFTGELGMLDAYFLYFSIPFFFLIENRILRFLIPALFVLCIMVHMSAVICYVVLMGILLLYRISIETESKNRKSLWVAFGLSMAAAAGIMVCFLAFTKEMPITVDEFNKMLEARGGKYFVYYDYVFYDHNYFTGKGLYPAELYSIEPAVWRGIRLGLQKLYFLHTEYLRVYMTNLGERILRVVVSLIVLSPLMCFFYRHIHRFFKSIEGNKLKKFSVFLMMVQFPFTLIVGYLFSVDIIRWFAHAFMISFAIFIYVIYKEKDFREEVLAAVGNAKNNAVVLIYLLAYFFINFSAYS